MMQPIDYAALAAPFEPGEIDWRVGQKSNAGDRATLLAYLTSRAVQDRLDTVVGPERWRDSYETLKDNSGKVTGFLCTLEIQVSPGVWIGKTDISDTTDIEALKGGVSGALKRAAVKWGVGRYLYGLDSRWYQIEQGYPPRGSDAIYAPLGRKGEKPSPGHIKRPQLPTHMLPGRPPKQQQQPQQQQQQQRPPPPSDDFRGRMLKRIEHLERMLKPNRISSLRTDWKINGLANASEEALKTYGKALAEAVRAEGRDR